jgi:hypothetical protein
MKVLSLSTVAALAIISAAAEASTECTGKVTKIWADASLGPWFTLDSGAIWYIAQPAGLDPNTRTIIALATTAMATERSVTVRFTADGVTCTSSTPRSDFVGMYLNSQ